MAAKAQEHKSHRNHESREPFYIKKNIKKNRFHHPFFNNSGIIHRTMEVETMRNGINCLRTLPKNFNSQTLVVVLLFYNYGVILLKGGKQCDLELFLEYIKHLKKFISMVEKSPSQRGTWRKSADQFEPARKSTDCFEPSRKSVEPSGWNFCSYDISSEASPRLLSKTIINNLVRMGAILFLKTLHMGEGAVAAGVIALADRRRGRRNQQVGIPPASSPSRKVKPSGRDSAGKLSVEEGATTLLMKPVNTFGGSGGGRRRRGACGDRRSKKNTRGEEAQPLFF
ncbi:hypothetical protein Cni_G01484 [Canna indica]|uniref:Uncharacterized protein n=1 Tax=Canna indica TaxID=4628 RepID=A0AAQ3JPC6_9LILI|nr:hypothetical protein Cni_G01484 [Canna indica]